MKHTKLGQPLKRQLGFTLVEILVVTAISSFIMLASTTLFISFMTTNRKTKVEQRVKIDGNNALNHIEYLLRNSKTVTSCSTGTTSIEFEDLLTNTYIISREINPDPLIGDRIKIVKNLTETIYVTGSKNEVTHLQFSCYQGVNNVQYIDFEFVIQRGLTSSDLADKVTANFQTGVTVRNTIFVN